TGCGGTDTALTLHGDSNTAGEIDLAPCDHTAQLSLVAPAPLTNEVTVAAVGALGDRRLTGNVTNDGTVTANTATGSVHLDGGGLFVNHRSVSIADGRALAIPDGASYEFRNDSGGSVAGSGSGQLAVGSGDTFAGANGSVTGNPVRLHGGAPGEPVVVDWRGAPPVHGRRRQQLRPPRGELACRSDDRDCPDGDGR